MPRFVLLVCVGLVACGRGSPKSEAQTVADRFVDLYFVEVDQQAALSLSIGLAQEALDKELAEVREVRATGYGPEQAKPKTYYKRTVFQIEGDGARAVYDLTIEHGGDRTHRQVLLTLNRRETVAWRVASFALHEQR